MQVTEPHDDPDLFRQTSNGREVLFLRACFRYGGFESPKRDCLHNDRSLWVDEPAKDGNIRTHCRRCGGLIGYRPAEGNA